MSTKARDLLELLQKEAYSNLGESPIQAANVTRKALDEMTPDLRRKDAEFATERIERLGHLEAAITRFESNPATQPKELADVRAQLAQLKADISKGLVERFNQAVPASRFDDPISTYLLSEWRQMVEMAIRSLSYPLPTELIIGTLPTGRVNAMTVAVPSTDEYVIIFESQLMPFLGLVAKLCSRALPLRFSEHGAIIASFDKVSIQKHIDQNESVIDDFKELLEAYLIVGRPTAVKWARARLGSNLNDFAGTLLYCMATFVLGHEYAHAFANHLRSARKVSATVAGRSVEEILWQWRQEDEADTYGMLIMLRAMQSTELWLRFWGPSLFFSCTEIVKKASSILLTGEESRPPLSQTHPPDQARRLHTRSLMVKILKTQWKSLGADAERVLDADAALEEIVKILWERVKPGLRDLYESGKRPLTPSGA